MPEVLLRESRDGVEHLMLNRPGSLNAIDVELVTELLAAIRAAGADRTVRAIVLSGAGRAFCAGADLKEAGAQSPRERDRWLQTAVDVHQAILDSPKPIVAQVHGYAIGLGCSIAVACDLVICAEGTVLGYPEVEHGLVPGISLAVLSRVMSARVVSELVLLARRIDAFEAVELGIANDAVPLDQLPRRIADLTDRLISMDPEAIRLSKRVARDLLGMPMDRRLTVGAEAVRIARQGREARDPSVDAAGTESTAQHPRHMNKRENDGS